ncbi:undecaprenyl-phosphate glucose phosphotransferase [Pseudomonas sp. CBMAI 2609]|uniref:Undecaprenyl-phosphate glucose phosphotransferase n=1 Tax=Pseudomonas flavocrustae TaxID=2991719 RepID=A0ABT6IKN3_9PSED|nr:undecaprenyl-phosphate glucose phosphotransferase [Pseudomonas sp. CBMAI 2609]MDH4764150.1 undecaprenyl-phosphate glucose phosphotransferase [Pseudomonas sp. CBMAI 2609]
MDASGSILSTEGAIRRLWYGCAGRTVYLVLISRILQALAVVGAGAYFYPIGTHWKAHGLLVLLVLAVFQAAGLYSDLLFSNLLRFRRLTLAWLIAFVLCLFVLQQVHPFSLQDQQEPLLKWFFGGLALLLLMRVLTLTSYGLLAQRGIFLQRAAILGATENGLRLANHMLVRQDFRCGLVGIVDDRTVKRLPLHLAGLPLLGGTQDLRVLIEQIKLDIVFIALPWTAERRIDQVTRVLGRLPVNVLLVPDLVALRYAQFPLAEVAGVHLFRVSKQALSGWAPLFKRIEDLLLTGLILPFVALPMLLIALIIKLDSPGPILFRQQRYGYNDRLIDVWKFRTMFVCQVDQDAVLQTTQDDPRVTRVGRWLRRFSLDELPQLFNVLSGNMSLVGPRPHAKATQASGLMFEDAVIEYSARHRMNPGMTGWAQVNGLRGETDTLDKIERRIEYDLRYIEEWSLWLDLYILLRTLPSLIWSRTAY